MNRVGSDQELSFVRPRKKQRIISFAADPCATVSPDFIRDAVIDLVRQLHGVVATSGAILPGAGMPVPAPLSADREAFDRSAP